MSKYNLGENNPLFNALNESKNVTEEKSKRGRPKNNNLVRGKSSQEGLTEEFTRATYLMRVDLVEKIKDYAYTERIDIKTAINKLIASALYREEERLDREGTGLLSHRGKK